MDTNAVTGTSGPLEGIKVLDWTMWQFGPVSTSMMGDMGADVIKIESFDGDAGRFLWQASNLPMDIGDGRNAYFETCNRNKRGMAVNLKTQEGKDIIYELVKKSDVFVQNFRQGVAERLGLGYESLSEINPMLVYGSANGYGPKGPDSHLPSFDGSGQARSGLMMSATAPKAEYPARISQGVSDQMGAIMLCLGVLAGLVSRQSRGRGQKVDVSHLSSNMWLQAMGMGLTLFLEGRSFEAFDREAPNNPLVNLYKCKDGKCFQLMHLQPDRYWKDFCQILDLPEVAEDPKYGDMKARAEHSREIVKILDERFASKTQDEWDRIFRSSGTDFIYSKVQAVEELVDDPQVIANDYITEFDHPVVGKVKMCNHPNIYSHTPAGIWLEAPELGQHTEAILIDELGYDWDDIERLKEAGAIL